MTLKPLSLISIWISLVILVHGIDENVADDDELHSKPFLPKFSWPHFYIVSVILGLLILSIIVGNVFVVAAILLEKNLRIVSNYLILSLAVADLLVATIVMPVSALQEVSKLWWLGIVLCDIWVCSDVLLCTVSIFHLVAIAIDRYFAISEPSYLQKRTSTRVLLMIAACWLSGVAISIPARFHANRKDEYDFVYKQGECSVNKEVWYTIFSNLGAFYIPTGFMLVIYAKIWTMARHRIRKKKFKQAEIKRTSIFQSKADVLFADRFGDEAKVKDPTLMGNLKSSTEEAFKKLCCLNKCDCGKKGKRTDNLSGVTVGAVAAGMRMASAIMSTTKSGQYRNSHDYNVLSFLNPYISESSSTDTISVEAKRPQIPLSYSIIMTCIHKNHEQDFLNSQNCSIQRDKSILFADDDSASNVYTIPESSESMYPLNTLNPSRPSQSSIVKEDRKPSNYMSLAVYEKRQKQIKWMKRQKVLEKAATKAMDMIVFDSASIDSITGVQLTPRERLEQKRERKAASTLAIITGCFLLCWLPFSLNTFINTVFLSPVEGDDGGSILNSLFLWLGYANSLLNPVIYTIFAPDFRNAFRKILFGRYRR